MAYWKTTTAFVLLLACENHAPNAQRELQANDIPRVALLARRERAQHFQGIQRAATMLAEDFVAPPESRERRLRERMKRLRRPSPRGSVAEFVSSPMTFLAAIDREGVVICRDSDEDRMKGSNFAQQFAVVREALAGRVSYGVGEFPSLEEGGDTSISLLFAAPVMGQGGVVGAVLLGVPLWREAQMMSAQLRLDHASEVAEGLSVWTYLIKGERVFGSLDAPPELLLVLPNAQARREGLERSPGGFTTHFESYGMAYGAGVVPAPGIGEDISILSIRSEPR